MHVYTQYQRCVCYVGGGGGGGAPGVYARVYGSVGTESGLQGYNNISVLAPELLFYVPLAPHVIMTIDDFNVQCLLQL